MSKETYKSLEARVGLGHCGLFDVVEGDTKISEGS
jgi:hypothetical protein